MTSPLRIIFAGTPDFAAAHLQVLLDSPHQLVACYTQPDRPAGRGKKLTPSPVKQAAVNVGIPVLQPQSLKDADAQAELAAFDADLMVVVAYGLLLPKAVLEAPRLGCINVHASLLPRWRGAAPIQRAIEAGDTESGVTIMQMDIGLDTGDMLVEARCAISPDDTGGSLHDRLMSLGGPALLTAIEQLATASAQPRVQDDSRANYAAKISKAEAELDWSLSATELDCKIRAFNPFPVTFTRMAKAPAERIRIWQASIGPATGRPGGDISAVAKDYIEVACGSGSLRIETLQLPGKRAMSVADVLRGNPDLFTVGDHLLEPGA